MVAGLVMVITAVTYPLVAQDTIRDSPQDTAHWSPPPPAPVPAPPPTPTMSRPLHGGPRRRAASRRSVMSEPPARSKLIR
jgi:hypothetical protein